MFESIYTRRNNNIRLQDGTSPLLAACEGGHTETAKLLIDKGGADVNQLVRVSFHLASSS